MLTQAAGTHAGSEEEGSLRSCVQLLFSVKGNKVSSASWVATSLFCLGVVPSLFNWLKPPTGHRPTLHCCFVVHPPVHTPAWECRRRSPAAWPSLAGIEPPNPSVSSLQSPQHRILSCPRPRRPVARGFRFPGYDTATQRWQQISLPCIRRSGQYWLRHRDNQPTSYRPTSRRCLLCRERHWILWCSRWCLLFPGQSRPAAQRTMGYCAATRLWWPRPHLLNYSSTWWKLPSHARHLQPTRDGRSRSNMEVGRCRLEPDATRSAYIPYANRWQRRWTTSHP